MTTQKASSASPVLPIHTVRHALTRAIVDGVKPVTILVAPTGSGKTTQLPQFLLDALPPTAQLVVTQPRRVAATSLAARVASERGSSLGQEIGYVIRFDDQTSSATRCRFVTDGIILRQALHDPLLSRYTAILVDEAHERSLRTDLLLGLLKRISAIRNAPGAGKRPLKIVIMSATLDASRFSNYFDRAPIYFLEGRQFSVTSYHLQASVQDYVQATLTAVIQIHTKPIFSSGHILVFLTGQDDIESTHKALIDLIPHIPSSSTVPKLLVLPLYAKLSPEAQNMIFNPAPAGTRKVILATNLAETSITIPGIRFVIDSGLVKQRHYHGHLGSIGIESLTQQPISQSSALQRSGRAGRDGPGHCFRLFPAQTFETLSMTTPPEILRTNLTYALLQLKALATPTDSFDDFEWLDEPDSDSKRIALTQLINLQAINLENGRITDLGKKMADFPLDPPAARCIFASIDLGCTRDMLDIVGILVNDSIWLDSSKSSAEAREASNQARMMFASRTGDHITSLRALRAYGDYVRTVRTQYAKDFSIQRALVRDWCNKHFLSERNIKKVIAERDSLRVACDSAKIDWREGPSMKMEDESDLNRLLQALLTGYFQNTALITADGTYSLTLGRQIIKIHPSSVLHLKKVPAIVFQELTYTTAVYARGVSAIERDWLTSMPILRRA